MLTTVFFYAKRWSCSRSANLGRTCSIGRLLDTQGGRYLKPRPPGRYIKRRPPPRNAVAAARRGSPERRRVPPAAVFDPMFLLLETLALASSCVQMDARGRRPCMWAAVPALPATAAACRRAMAVLLLSPPACCNRVFRFCLKLHPSYFML